MARFIQIQQNNFNLKTIGPRLYWITPIKKLRCNKAIRANLFLKLRIKVMNYLRKNKVI